MTRLHAVKRLKGAIIALVAFVNFIVFMGGANLFIRADLSYFSLRSPDWRLGKKSY